MALRLPSGKWVRNGLSLAAQQLIEDWIRSNGNRVSRQFSFWMHRDKVGSYSIVVHVDLASSREDGAVHGVVGVPHIQFDRVSVTTPGHAAEDLKPHASRELDEAEIALVVASPHLPASLLAWTAGILRAHVASLDDLTDAELARAAM